MTEKIALENSCPFCGAKSRVYVFEADWIDYIFKDFLVQDAFPYLSADDREIIISGMCKDCQNKIFN